MASVRKRDPADSKSPWVVEYTDAAGKRRRKTPKSGLKKDADAIRQKVEREIERGEHVASSQTVTLGEAIDLWLTNCEDRVKARDRFRPRTLRNFRSIVENHLRPTLGTTLLTDLTFHSVQAWIDRLAFDQARPRSHAVINATLVLLRLILKHAFTKQLIGRNVLKDHEFRVPGKSGKKVEIPTKPEIKKFLARADQRTMGRAAPYLKPILYVAVFGGLRQGEIRALTWENVDLERGVIKVRVAADNFDYVDQPKTQAGVRDVPVAPALAVELKKWSMACGRPEAGLVFKGDTGRMVKQPCIYGSWRRLQFRVEHGRGTTAPPTSGYTFHALRHVAASLFIEAGLPPKRIQTIMGHTSIQMTFDLYGSLFDDPDLVSNAMSKIGRDIVA